MKRILTTIGLAAFLPLASQAQLSNVVHFLQASSDAKALTVAVAPSYAPDIVVDGKKSPWGMDVAALYPVFDAGILRGVTGLRATWLARQAFLPSVDVQLQTKAILFNKIEATPFLVTGAIFPLSQGNASDSVGAIVGSGIAAKLFEVGKVRVSAGYEAEKWTCFPGIVHHVGGAVTFTW